MAPLLSYGHDFIEHYGLKAGLNQHTNHKSETLVVLDSGVDCVPSLYILAHQASYLFGLDCKQKDCSVPSLTLEHCNDSAHMISAVAASLVGQNA